MGNASPTDAYRQAGAILAQAHVTASGDYWKSLAFDLAKAVIEESKR